MNPATPSTGTRPDVIVVGGGIGGLSTAFALTRAGLRVRVLERAKEFGEVGAGLQIAPNCTRILAEYGLLEEARTLGVVPENMVMRDALDSRELTRLDLRDLERRYGFPYMVIHRSDLHGIFLRACERAGVELLTDQSVVGYEHTDGGALIRLEDGSTQEAPLVVAADGLHSVARRQLVGDDVVSSDYVAYRAAVPIEQVRDNGIAEKDVTVYVGPRCHFVQYALRGGEMFNQVAVFESPKALAGQEDWGTPDELDAAFEATCDTVRKGIPLMWRDRWWQMLDRDPIETWVHGRIALLGDAAHPPLQYMAQGAIMAIEDGWVLARHIARHAVAGHETPQGLDAALAAYEAVRVEHCRRVQTTARAWGELWHLDGDERLQRNTIMRGLDIHDYGFTDWVYGPTALTPDEEPAMFTPIPLESVPAEQNTGARTDAVALTAGSAR
ncbi:MULTISPECIES: FAD-dependent oxidoreductase [unclassified Streptomyces]|uniref:FAD-dependent oxidoreductase n=1 Tax=unclassified Streptomyces TaxID=2593676 RepID=UPI002E801AB9|nr:FAD-dependent oxidoreductase [Streptomyces sp. NBC_00589]WTI35687.1 FAD-dependent oxidoreductase [Streptomyces sp. NBC_00775]WUB30639.1 FAD-dependent oxidoreductase [Streptomyces sp. NBC_00589]